MDFRECRECRECRQCRSAAAEKNIITALLFYITAVITIILLAEGMIQCGTEKTLIPAYQMVNYVPQAIFLPVAPFLNLITYQMTASGKRKLIQYGIVVVLFTASLWVTMDRILPQLTGLYGNAELVSFGYPMCFYMSAVMALLGEYGGSRTVKSA